MDINNTELQQEERIMSFLRGKMTEAEEAIFMDDIQKNAEFKAKAIILARLAKGMSQVGMENDKVLKEAFLSSDVDNIKIIAKRTVNSESTSKHAKKVPFRKLASILSIAASLLFVVYLGFWYNEYNKTIILGEQYAMKYEKSNIRGAEQAEVSDEVETLINNVYNNTDLEETLKRLSVLWEVSTMDTYNDYTEYAPIIGWALATGYLKDNNKDEAKNILKKMAKLYADDDALRKKVSELLMKIEQL